MRSSQMKCRSQRAVLATTLAALLAAGACAVDRLEAGSSSCGFEGGTGCAPASKRVDLYQPSFSDPTHITNPFFPTSTLTQVVQLGEEAHEPARVEITLLPETRTIEWDGREVETVVRQFIAYSDGLVVEVALDFLAQADDGSVWYFGEDVFNYEDGIVADRDGTWLAGRDGPAGMIMPAHPKVGDVYRPENIPGLVFEEVTVTATGETMDGPWGPIEGAIRTREQIEKNVFEDKAFAPGYGEFHIQTEDELIDLALALPPDARPGPPPAELVALSTGAASVFEAAGSGEWKAASAGLATMNPAWAAIPAGGAPRLLCEQMGEALAHLDDALEGGKLVRARQAAVDAAHAALDLQLLHRPPAAVDVDRLAVWARQVLIDAGADDPGAVAGDIAVLETIAARVRHSLDAAAAARLDARVATIRRAADDDDGRLRAVAKAVPELLRALEELGRATGLP
jgi:hypothetical protein